MAHKSSPSNLALALTPFLTAIFGVSTGASLGVVHLASIPIEEVQSIPEDAAPGQIFLLETPRTGFSWDVREEEFLGLEAGVVRIVEGELNSWLSARLREAKASPDAFLRMVSLPVVRIEGQRLHVAVKLGIDTGAGGGETWLQLEGEFENSADGPRFLADGGSLGSGRLPGPIAQSLLAMAVAEPLKGDSVKPVLEAWDKVKEIQVEDGALVLLR
ncbi:MAG: hypothetical protein ACFBZ8_04795 [Opitutales bacterium]